MAQNQPNTASELQDPSVASASGAAPKAKVAGKPGRPAKAAQEVTGKATVVRCFHERVGGSDIPIENTMYRFRPNKAGHHVCEVTNPKHLKLFLAADHSYIDYATPQDEQYPVVPGSASSGRARVTSGQVPIVDEIVGDDEGLPYEEWTLEQLSAEVQGQFKIKEANTFVMARLGKDMFELDLNPNDEPRGMMIKLLEAYDERGGKDDE